MHCRCRPACAMESKRPSSLEYLLIHDLSSISKAQNLTAYAVCVGFSFCLHECNAQSTHEGYGSLYVKEPHHVFVVVRRNSLFSHKCDLCENQYTQLLQQFKWFSRSRMLAICMPRLNNNHRIHTTPSHVCFFALHYVRWHAFRSPRSRFDALFCLASFEL
jgi:hypothetical protein